MSFIDNVYQYAIQQGKYTQNKEKEKEKEKKNRSKF